MKTLRTHTRILASVLLATFGLSAQADTLINNFTTPFDYAANGIIGDTNWDGMYLRFGDIPGGIVGGNPAGATAIANSGITYPGYLSLRSSGGDWAAADDDGVFLWKLVAGDFDVSVQSSPFNLTGGLTYDNGAYHMAGLMARSYAPDNSGAPYSTSSTNALENYVMLLRFQQFGINEVNEANNGARIEHTFPDGTDAASLGQTRYFRMVRSSLTNFTFYWKTNLSDSWVQITANFPGGVLVRSDLTGPLQVGIAQSPFSTGTHDAVFTDFQLSGANVNFPTLPSGAPSALVTTATNAGGSLTLSWTRGTPGASNLVVMSRYPIQNNPVQGITYAANSAYGTAGTLLGGSGEYVVYNGTNTSVTVTNLGANNLTYYAAVYEYGSGPIYNTASPATNAFAGPGIITGSTLSTYTNAIPLNGAVVIKLMATFSTGELSDQTPNSTWTSSDPTIANVNAAGVVSAISTGTATITGTFGTFAPTMSITVRTPVFTDTFTNTHDYLGSGLVGTPYDGLFLNMGDVPGAAAGGDGPGSTVAMDSQITTTNGLYISSVQSTWSSASDDGPFLYKIVPGSANGVSGDFSAVLHIANMNNLNGVFAGLMARLYNPANHGPGPGGTEYHLNYWKQQNGLTRVRRTQAGGGGGTDRAVGPNANASWLLLQRVSSTNFYFFEKVAAGDPWILVTNIVMAAASNNAPMEVGIAQQSISGLNAITTFDSLMIDAAGLVTATTPPAPASNLVMTLNPNLSSTITYKVGTNLDGTAIRSIVVMRDAGPVTAQPYTGMGLGGNSVFGDPNNCLGGGNYVVFRSTSGSSNTTQSVTVTGLTPGHTYYAAVFTFTGTGAARTFNNDASKANSSMQDGSLDYIEFLPTPPVPRGGIGVRQAIAHYAGGGTLNISPFATIVSADTNVIKVLNGLMTGITNGTSSVSLIYSGVTNVETIIVRDPVFVDNFGTTHDYLVSGVTGSSWDGMYNANPAGNPIPLSPYAPPAGSGATVAYANTNALTITAAGDGWENANAGGFFLFKYVPSDFQMAIHIPTNNYLTTLGPAGQFQYNQPGLLARAYSIDTNSGKIGAPLGVVVPNANGTNDLGEYWVSICRFDEFNIGTYPRRNIDSAVSQNGQTDQGDMNYWLLIVRSKGTEFDFYKRLNETDPWKQLPNKPHYSIPQFAGRPMQVGIMAGPWSGAQQSVTFEKFMLDATTGSQLAITVSGTNVTLSWQSTPNVTLQTTGSLSPANWQPVAGPYTLGPAGYSKTLSLGSGPQFFRLAQ